MKGNKIKIMVAAMLIAITGVAFAGCGKDTTESGAETTISVSGSTSVGPLMEKIAETYEGQNSGVIVEIQQPGSGTGIKNVMEGVAEIGMSSRELSSDELESVQGTTIAYDGIAILVNSNNPVDDLSLGDLNLIFKGVITNWNEVGGNDSPIVVISREEGSGTRTAFQEIVGYEAEELVGDAMISDGSGAVKTTVVGNENAIGYASFEYVDDTVKALKIDGIEPLAENVKDASYKISRPFILVTKSDKLTDAGKKLIEYVVSDEGQKIVEENSLITID